MRGTEWLQAIQRVTLEEAHRGGQERELTDEQAGQLPGVSLGTCRRNVERHEDGGREATSMLQLVLRGPADTATSAHLLH